jgi:CBS domain-containing protein
MLAGELMTQRVVTIGPDASLNEAVVRLNAHRVTSMPVVDQDNRLIGVVSEADLLRDEVFEDPLAAEGRRGPYPRVVGEVMTTHVVSVTEDANVVDVARVMFETSVKSIPVVRGDTVIGIVSRSDLIHALATIDDRIRDEINALFDDAGLPGWTVKVEEGEVWLTGPDGGADARTAAVLARTVRGVASVAVVTERPVAPGRP